MDNSLAPRSRHMDRLAIALSGLCLVHCLALTVGAIALPAALGTAFDGGWTHLLMLIVVIPLSAFVLPRGYREHGRAAVLWLGGTGLTLMILGATLGHHVYGPLADTVLTAGGAIILAVAHALNAVCCGRLTAR